MSVAIVDIGMGNVGSVANMVRKAGGRSEIVADPSALAGAERIVLPGVGSFDEAMHRLESRGFREHLDALAHEGTTPILGICLGMQLLADRSEEGVRSGLGWIPGSVERLPSTGPGGVVKVPHMGWSRVTAPAPHPLVDALDAEARFYFVHSYAFVPAEPHHVLLLARYGGRDFVAGVRRGSVLGVQFHPEKSHRHGLALMKAFVEREP